LATDTTTLAVICGSAVALLAIGVGLGWLMGSQHQRGINGTLLNRIADLTARYELRSADTERLMLRVDELGTADVKCAALSAQLEAERLRSADRIATMQQADASLREAFHAVSAVALRYDSESFLKLARASLPRADAPEGSRNAASGEASGAVPTHISDAPARRLDGLDLQTSYIDQPNSAA
jgi:hypothetical protein